MLPMLSVITFLPLLSAVLNGLLKNHLNKLACNIIALTGITVSTLLSAYVFYLFYVQNIPSAEFTLYNWISFFDVSFDFGFLIDKLSSLMIFIVTFVSMMVHIYTVAYMDEDQGYIRFFAYISLFTFAMLFLVLSNNLVQMFFGWEGVGLVSYLLIGFWFDKPSAIKANLKAFLVNRLGDCGLILGIAGVYFIFNTTNYLEVFNLLAKPLTSPLPLWIVTACIFVGAMAKSAQIPLHIWLPDSMEGPTPISALIHAATMVTAGVYLVARLGLLFNASPLIQESIMLIGAATALLLGLVAIFQTDIKRVIAYSTISQLGYMVTALGVGGYDQAIFHLLTHAFFKASLFLSAGAIIISLHHEQDIFKMGNLRQQLPIIYALFLLGTLALVGFPGFAGFYSKSAIIEAVANSPLPYAQYAHLGLLAGVFVTSLYSFRLFFIVFHRHSDTKAHHISRILWLPIVMLIIPSVIVGAIYVGDGWFTKLLHGFIEQEFLMVFLGFTVAWLCCYKFPKISTILATRFKYFNLIFIYKYGLDLLVDKIVVPSVRLLGKVFWQGVDLKIVDHSVNTCASLINSCANTLRKLQTGLLYHYVFVVIASTVLLLAWLVQTQIMGSV
jgi:NADH-quinone oxidoreductase subunit L